MDRFYCDEILQTWDIDQLSRDRQIIEIFNQVRDIPFGRSGTRDPEQVFIRNKGTCSGKSFLIRDLYLEIGLEVRDMICLQRWRDLIWFPTDTYPVVDFPPDLRRMLERIEIVDFHNYLEVKKDGKWLSVDVSIDRPLTALGFYTTLEWDGKTSMPLCFVETGKSWNCGLQGEEKKKELTSQLPVVIREARNKFLEALTAWIDQFRLEKLTGW